MIVDLLVVCIVLLAAAVVFLARALASERRRPRGVAAAARTRAPEPDAGWLAMGAGGGRVTPAAGAPGSAAPGDDFGRDTELRHLLGLLSHELRSPLGAIVGYQELLTDGLLGPLPDKALDAIRRIGTSGGQLRHLIDGLTDLLIPERDITLDLQQVEGTAIAGVAAESARALAAGRSVQLQVVAGEALPSFVTDAGRLGAALDLAIGAAVRASPGATLTLTFTGEGGALVARVDGTALDPARDAPVAGDGVGAPGGSLAESGIRSGAGLRLAMAARIAEILGGELTLQGHAPASLRLRIPPAPIDASAPRS